MAKKIVRQRYFGLTKVKKGDKAVWLSKQDKNGWSLGYALNSRTVWLTGLRFSDPKEIAKILSKGKIVFVQLKNNK